MVGNKVSEYDKEMLSMNISIVMTEEYGSLVTLVILTYCEVHYIWSKQTYNSTMKIAHCRTNARIVIRLGSIGVGDMDVSPLNEQWYKAVEIGQILSNEMFYEIVLNPGTSVSRRTFMRKYAAVGSSLDKQIFVVLLGV
jgi:hypothetical protein